MKTSELLSAIRSVLLPRRDREPYPMRSSAYYGNLAVMAVVLLGSVIIYAVGTSAEGVSAQIRAAGTYASPVSLYALGALIALVVVRRSRVVVAPGVRSACQVVTGVAVLLLVGAVGPYLLPSGPDGVTLPAMLLWALFSFPLSLVALGAAYAFAWAPAKGDPLPEERPRGHQAERGEKNGRAAGRGPASAAAPRPVPEPRPAKRRSPEKAAAAARRAAEAEADPGRAAAKAAYLRRTGSSSGRAAGRRSSKRR